MSPDRWRVRTGNLFWEGAARDQNHALDLAFAHVKAGAQAPRLGQFVKVERLVRSKRGRDHVRWPVSENRWFADTKTLLAKHGMLATPPKEKP